MKRRWSSDKNEQPIKKQCAVLNHEVRPREIRSSSSERSLQLLYQGATQQYRNAQDLKDSIGSSSFNCFYCHTQLIRKKYCSYCERSICENCTNFCNECKEDYCRNCSFNTFNQQESLCYTCYK